MHFRDLRPGCKNRNAEICTFRRSCVQDYFLFWLHRVSISSTQITLFLVTNNVTSKVCTSTNWLFFSCFHEQSDTLKISPQFPLVILSSSSLSTAYLGLGPRFWVICCNELNVCCCWKLLFHRSWHTKPVCIFSDYSQTISSRKLQRDEPAYCHIHINSGLISTKLDNGICDIG